MELKGLVVETYYTQRDLEYTLQGAMVYYEGKLVYHCTDIQTFRKFLSIFNLELYSPTKSETTSEGVTNTYKTYKEFKLEPYTSMHELPDELMMVEVVLNGSLYVGYVEADKNNITLYYPNFEEDKNLHKMTHELSKYRKTMSSNLIFHIN
ncbi:hypothetical protein P4493_05805 [Bacillus thuringiensis]|uniref:Uncharacterized protein n=3 Tax=Bacillus thuringiensis TaxID=1428 RepID=A0A0B5NKW3_BACTU|nr:MULTISPECIES: hypothetical protein [Bacillus]EAO52471.1 hypothetical protein RBTH_04129 [Bacillus thuringiensis serovar israelensis ATCC 35646]MEC2533077.1 hypothetical protein [Bacillus cereus]MED1153943.1 hypothetical protein [Bacillus paranthracis]OUB09217.1 hypothetical protein BK708_32290 [Bacillus thuringiensis serovar yunnanensis]AFQ29815.1 hypothetical protein BTF1_28572 [Bacillus thuringiensis HD-789]